ncbi:DUF397 domain-containing protein [Streptomyces sp. SID14515]|uniref:DUF397 domain-containing protein n=1 Tax=Streptomyces sp. SID14515 TaxID=2706074 RepID=UPI0013C54ADB|nr:DUF397 domain-containing protein [Streptomyces sp. SID14515]
MPTAPRPARGRTGPAPDNAGNCVEVAACPHSVHVRDSKVTVGPAFAVAPDAWSAFVTWAE